MLEEKLKLIRKHDQEGRIRVMIIGLGSVGNYLLSYLLSSNDENLEIVVAGRNAEKLQCDVNIARVAALIRRQNKSNVIVDGTCNLDDVDSIAALISKYQPDFIVNSSRVYPGLKYGSISWKNIRAYGIWTPLAIKYIRNIMLGYTKAEGKGIVINTSYSDGTIPWLKSSGVAYPDFGSGNLNHLLPRLKFAIANEIGVSDFWNIDVDIATAHFHDVVISKEGQNEGLEQLLKASYKGEEIKLDQDDILRKCVITMPNDMISKNRQSLALDGVEDIRNGCLVYTDDLIKKSEKAFGVTLPKIVPYDNIDATAEFIIKDIITPALEKGLNK